MAREFGRKIKKYTLLVTKSTVPVGTAAKVKAAIAEELAKRGEDVPFDVASNPEFLKEGAAIKDFMSPDRVVVGVGKRRGPPADEPTLPPIPAQQFPGDIHRHTIGRDDKICRQFNARHTHIVHERHSESV